MTSIPLLFIQADKETPDQVEIPLEARVDSYCHIEYLNNTMISRGLRILSISLITM